MKAQNFKLQKFNNFVIFKTDQGKVNIDVFFANDTLWLTQKIMSELFDVEVNTINYHLKEIFKSNELVENSVIRKIRTTAKDGKKYLWVSKHGKTLPKEKS